MLTYAAILIGIALVLFFIEIFVPSGGIVGFLAVGSLIAGIVCLFWVDQTVGLLALLLVLVLTPFAIGLSLKIFPNTPIIRRLTLEDRQPAGEVRDDPSIDDPEEESLVGRTGVADGWLRPVGTCRIDGQRIPCRAETGSIEPGTPVRVTAVDGMEAKVRPVES
jgi:membrane-bound serine protease (ClpP class)